MKLLLNCFLISRTYTVSIEISMTVRAYSIARVVHLNYAVIQLFTIQKKLTLRG